MFVAQTVEIIISGWSVSKIIILSFRVDTSKNKNIDHVVNETCDIRSTQVTYEIDHISLLQGSTISSGLIFCFMYFILI